MAADLGPGTRLGPITLPLPPCPGRRGTRRFSIHRAPSGPDDALVRGAKRPEAPRGTRPDGESRLTRLLPRLRRLDERVVRATPGQQSGPLRQSRKFPEKCAVTPGWHPFVKQCLVAEVARQVASQTLQEGWRIRRAGEGPGVRPDHARSRTAPRARPRCGYRPAGRSRAPGAVRARPGCPAWGGNRFLVFDLGQQGVIRRGGPGLRAPEPGERPAREGGRVAESRQVGHRGREVCAGSPGRGPYGRPAHPRGGGSTGGHGSRSRTSCFHGRRGGGR